MNSLKPISICLAPNCLSEKVSDNHCKIHIDKFKKMYMTYKNKQNGLVKRTKRTTLSY